MPGRAISRLGSAVAFVETRGPLRQHPDTTVTVGLVQAKATADKAKNLSRTLDRIREAAARGAKLVCLQELFASQYPCQEEDPALFDLAEPIPGDTTNVMSKVARELEISIVVPLFEKRAAGVYHNSIVVMDPRGKIVGHYRKMHIPDDPHYYEKFYFTPGDLGFIAVQTPVATLGPLICWDQWYPEAARLASLRGAQILCYPTAIGWFSSEKAEHGASQLDAWRTVQRAHAISNGVFVVAVNRVGHEGPEDGGIEFWGHSFVCDPLGRVIAEAGHAEEVMVAECDLTLQEQARRDWPFLRDRRIDAYAGLESRLLDAKD